ncbi:hypothetical protein VHEMI07607 [[Torrubiella] hemipterigena]|uniref:Uncharacterized protein n=1 Tax=[Torrubiella] hemipterigena TaxID=1531966 RepID=A0A0A1TAW6_9HYPO|nr:hypothetical protein VHEMI07607 [[Torrubiella] hemipterigena]
MFSLSFKQNEMMPRLLALIFVISIFLPLCSTSPVAQEQLHYEHSFAVNIRGQPSKSEPSKSESSKANPGKSETPKLGSSEPPPGLYEKAVTKGQRLYALFGVDAATAVRRDREYGVQSQFLELTDLQKFGWTNTPTTSADFYGNKLHDAFLESKINEKGKVSLIAKHDSTFTEAGQSQLPTDGVYRSGMYPDNEVGALVADKNYSPRDQANEGAHIPGLNQWSDVAFLQWRQACDQRKKSASALKYIFRASIQNTQTLAIIRRILMDLKHKEFPSWQDRVKIPMTSTSSAGMALLGSKNGASSAFLLIQHKAQLDTKTISEAVIWSSEKNIPLTTPLEKIFTVHMRFEVTNVRKKREVDDEDEAYDDGYATFI